MTNVRPFGNQYQCVDCGAVWDVDDREPHVCLPPAPRGIVDATAVEVRDEIPHADTLRNKSEMKRVKAAINEMLRSGETSCKIKGALSKSIIAHLESRGYSINAIGFEPYAITQVYVK